jgi:hypothetical protein
MVRQTARFFRVEASAQTIDYEYVTLDNILAGLNAMTEYPRGEEAVV